MKNKIFSIPSERAVHVLLVAGPLLICITETCIGHTYLKIHLLQILIRNLQPRDVKYKFETYKSSGTF